MSNTPAARPSARRRYSEFTATPPLARGQDPAQFLAQGPAGAGPTRAPSATMPQAGGAMNRPGPAGGAGWMSAKPVPQLWQWKGRIAASELGQQLQRPLILTTTVKVAFLLCTALAAYVSWRSGAHQWWPMVWLLRNATPEALTVVGLGSLSAYLLFLVQALTDAFDIQRKKNASTKWGSSLDDKQRKLLGLSPVAPGRHGSATKSDKQTQQAPASAQKPARLLGPPQRPGRAHQPGTGSYPGGAVAPQRGMYSPYTPQQAPGSAMGEANHHSDWGSAGVSRSGFSPLSHRSAGTPEPQLDDYLRHLDSEMALVATPPHAAAYDPASAFLRGYSARRSPSPFSHTPMGGPSPAAGAQSVMLPHGMDAPKYRPSPQPRSTAGVPREDGRIAASPPEVVGSVLLRLKTSGKALEIWTERFREWMAFSVLQPLVQAMDSAASEVLLATQAVGWQGIRLSELGVVPDTHGQAHRHMHGGEADEQLMISQLLDSLEAKGRTQPLAPQDVACYEAVNKYKNLSKLLNGLSPGGILPPAPRGYVAARVRQLAASSCMMDFEWNKGGDFAGKPWNTELPTDSALVLFLFAAFLEAPHWEWPQGPAGTKGARAGPLYISNLPTRPAEQFTAILPFRPVAVHQGAVAILGLALASANPHFALLLEGEVAVTFAGSHATFHSILLFLQYVRLNRLSLLGEHHLDRRQLDLAWVIQDVPQATSLKTHWFGLW